MSLYQCIDLINELNDYLDKLKLGNPSVLQSLTIFFSSSAEERYKKDIESFIEPSRADQLFLNTLKEKLTKRIEEDNYENLAEDVASINQYLETEKHSLIRDNLKLIMDDIVAIDPMKAENNYIVYNEDVNRKNIDKEVNDQQNSSSIASIKGHLGLLGVPHLILDTWQNLKESMFDYLFPSPQKTNNLDVITTKDPSYGSTSKILSSMNTSSSSLRSTEVDKPIYTQSETENVSPYSQSTPEVAQLHGETVVKGTPEPEQLVDRPGF